MFDPRRFMQVVDHVLQTPECGGEAFARTAVGRAYYSAYLASREYLLGAGTISRNKKGRVGHGPVIRGLDKGQTQLLASVLDQLRTLRGQADYDLNSEVPSSMALQAKQLADLMLSRLQAAPTKPHH